MASKFTTDDFKKYVKDIEGENYTVLSEYKGTNEKITMKHNECGNKYDVTPNKFKQGRRCPFCNPYKTVKTTESFKKEVFEKRNGEYEILGEYKTKSDKILVKHNACGKTFEAIAANLVRTNHPTGCPHCFGNKAYLTTEYKQKVDEMTKGNFELISEYKNRKEAVEIRHNECGKTFFRIPDKINQRGLVCPFCEATKGETRVIEYLNSHNIEYEFQKSFDDLKLIKHLRLDFVVTLPSGKMFVIEFDGEYHFGEVHRQTNDDYETQKLRDAMKERYCIDKEIQLLRIPYWEIKNIDSILDDIIEKLEGSTTILKESTVESYWKKEASYLLI